jgi:hypothetical protein
MDDMVAPIPARPYRDRLPPEAEEWLHTGEINSSWYYLTKISPRELWDIHRDRIVREHVEREAGTRPRLWWRWEAKQMRQRLGGVGTPLHECSAQVPSFEFGIPRSWKKVKDWHLSRGVPISEADPPRYESEAAYLERLNLWLPGEKACVKRADWRPVEVRYRRYPNVSHVKHSVQTFPQWEVVLHRVSSLG